MKDQSIDTPSAAGGFRLSALSARQKVLVPLAVVLVIVCSRIPGLYSPDNIAQVLREAAVPSIMAVGVTFVVISGRLDLSIGSLLTLCALSTLTLHDAVSPGLAVVMSLFIGVAVGLINGVLVAYLRLNSLIATLGMLALLQGVALLITDGQDARIHHKTAPWFAYLGRGYLAGVPTPVVIVVVIAVLMGLLLGFSNFGRRVYAVGGNETASAFSGVDTRRTILFAYLLSGLFTGVAAVVLSSRVMASQNDTGSGYELSVLSGVILGGTSLLGGSGGVGRSVAGIVLLAFIQNALLLLGLPYYFQWIITGIVIVGAVWIDLISRRGRIFA